MNLKTVKYILIFACGLLVYYPSQAQMSSWYTSYGLEQEYIIGGEVNQVKDRLMYEKAVAVQRNGKWGYIDLNGQEFIPLEYDSLGVGFHEGLSKAKKHGRWGYINKNNKAVIPFIYEQAEDFSYGLAAVKIGNKYGYIDHLGTMVLPFIYDTTMGFKQGGLAKVRQHGRYGYINTMGEYVIPLVYEDMGDFSEGIVWGSMRVLDPEAKTQTWNRNENVFSKKRQFVYMDIKGHSKLCVLGNVAKDYADGVLCVYLWDESFRMKIIDLQGREYFKMEDRYCLFVDRFRNGFSILYTGVNVTPDNFRDLEKDKKNMKDTEYDFLISFSEYRLIRKNGDFLKSKDIYNSIAKPEYIGNNLYKIEKYTRSVKVLNISEKKQNTFAYSDIFSTYYNDGMYPTVIYELYSTPTLYGFINQYGQEVIPCRYDSATPYLNGLARVAKGQKVGYIDKYGNEVIPVIYPYNTRFEFRGNAHNQGYIEYKTDTEWKKVSLRRM